MPTTYNWIYLGVPRAADNSIISIDPTEGTAATPSSPAVRNATSENANLLVNRTFGAETNPLYTRITSTTVSDNGGTAGALDTDNTFSNDTFVTNIGSGNQTFTFDGVATYGATVTYADGTTATTTVILAQSTTGELFLAPPPATANPVLTAKPLVSVSLNSLTNATNLNYNADRLQIGWDDGFIDGTAGNDLIDTAYIEPIGSGSDVIDGGDGISSSGTGWNDDRVRAGAGNDTILSGAGNDLVLGEAGDDSIDGGAGNDTIDAGDGNDT
ncbi:calcium-binding protein, partial [Paracoccus sp. (in: a-proteobacteria)]|uniref:calcium-binding protein n=1 Tax=Paracoccus sp. TaxID=267 RepID=UPI00396C642E